MIYFYCGSDTQKVCGKVQATVDLLLKKKPDASLIRTTGESFSPNQLDGLIGGQGLFEQKLIVVCDELFENDEIKKEIVTRIKEFQKSENIFLFIENKIDSATKKKLEKYAEKIEFFEMRETVKKEEFNVFSLSDALGERNARLLWTLYRKAKMRDMSDEEIHGILFWGVKNMLLAQSCRSAEEAGLNPFVFRKASSFARHFSSDELCQLSRDLVHLYHDAHAGRIRFSEALELFVLGV